MSIVRIIETAPHNASWTDRLSGSWKHWRRLEDTLRTDPKWNSLQIDSVSAESLRVLQRLPDPTHGSQFQGRGLVVGYVQSGKTANYTAVAARAVDAGYRMVIVLSGIHDSLRNQTQARLERELVGTQTPSLNAKERAEWILLTSCDDDFKGASTSTLNMPGIFLAVVKKNVNVLRKLDHWLELSIELLFDFPVLIIDDEADQASINTRSKRPLDAAVSDDEEGDEDVAPSRTNGLIRSILKRLNKAAYVAYTATPFANILISPDADDQQFGEDLFPKDFVIQLPRPMGYTGTEELFGTSAQGRNVLQVVSEADVKSLRGARRRKNREIILEQPKEHIPDSLIDAIITFCLAGAIRKLRGIVGKPHTMLVHVSQRTDDQRRIADAIRYQLDLWREAERQGQNLENIIFPVWHGMKDGIDIPHEEDIIITIALQVLREIIVLELNSVTGESLDYEEKPSRHIIAVGGNRLSRGLTLEGLTISYFLRTASMCDTLLQMARWYGFRSGYEDLIRIWTTDGIARWFSELALVEQSLRDSIVALSRAGRRPDQMAIRLRAHSDLLLTSRNKSTTALTQQDSWSGEHPQTVLLPLSNSDKLKSNLSVTASLIDVLSPLTRCSGGFLVRDIASDAIAAFLRSYQIHEDIVVFRNDLLADWIMTRSSVGELMDWSIFVASPADGRPSRLGGLDVGLVRRKRISSESIGILTDPAHEGVDLPFGSGAYRRDGGAYDAEAMRAARPSTQGLLMIYPLDPDYLGIQSKDPVIALALSLPQTSDSGTAWIVNSKVANG